MNPLTRREGLASILSSFAVYALVGEARAATGSIGRWIDEQQALAEDLAAGRIAGSDWSLGVERLAHTVDPDELAAVIARSRMMPGGKGSANDPAKRVVRFLDDDGQPRQLSYGVALFDFAPHNVITPHGHRHMVSAHMVVKGAVRIRNFDRVGDEDGAMLLRPTRDYVASAGQVSTMCSERDNIHWFVPQSGPATTFDVVISGLDPGAPDYDIKAVDPLRGERLADGIIRAPIIDFEESARFYTAVR
ncbi:hypothetical protein HJG53_10950 [Sphingomonas sp. ID1715]|uniref:hypothetical protein n=1 Tax=Sphingomonas sp. ID1715 TaxID=1656898 RepID=UPI0014878D6A|nr:hypothetical protein [Sphingomonas sp. ID1715]NNM77423.1 hypothetical protein [Sphingomonas sp. ID1715]